MNAPIFQGLYYHIQIWDIDRELQSECRNKLESHGARYCADPCSPQCQLIVVDTSKKSKKFIYQPKVRIPAYDQLRNGGGWTYDALCYHLAQRRDKKTDRHPESRKTVVAVGWVDECLERGERLVDNSHAGWEVKVFLPIRSKDLHGSNGKSRVKQDFAPHLLDVPSGSQSPMRFPLHEASPAPSHSSNVPPPPPINPLLSEPTLVNMPSEIPPSPPLTATGSVIEPPVPKVFESLTNDPNGSRTFFVAATNVKFMTEFFIKTNGGELDELVEATFIIVDASTPSNLASPREMLGKLRRKQFALTPQWVEECVRLNALVRKEPYIIGAHDEPKPVVPKTREMEVIAPTPAEPTPPPETASLKRARPLSMSDWVVERPTIDIPRPPTVDLRFSRAVHQGVDPRVRPPLSSAHSARPSVDPRVRPRLSSEYTATPPPPQKLKPSPRSTMSKDLPRKSAPPLLPSEDELQARIRQLQDRTTLDKTPEPLRRPESPGSREKPAAPVTMVVDVPMFPPPTATQTQLRKLQPSSGTPPRSTRSPPTALNGLVKTVTHATAISQVRLIPAPELTPFTFNMSPTPPAIQRSSKLPTPAAPAIEDSYLSEVASPVYPPEPLSPHDPSELPSPRYGSEAPSFPYPSEPPSPRQLSEAPSIRYPSEPPSPRYPSEAPSVPYPSYPPSPSYPSESPEPPATSQVKLIYDYDPPGWSSSSHGLPKDPVPNTSSTRLPSTPRASKDQELSATPSPSSTEPSSSTAPSEPGSPSAGPSKKNNSQIPSSPTSKPKLPAWITYKPQSMDPLLVTGGLEDTAPIAKLPTLGAKKRQEIAQVSSSSPGLVRHPEVVAARLDELVTKIEAWLGSGTNINKRQFLKQLRTVATGFDWYSLYYRKRGTVRSRLLAMGRTAAELDGAGIMSAQDKVTCKTKPYSSNR